VKALGRAEIVVSFSLRFPRTMQMSAAIRRAQKDFH
jgi:hypothetical protein